MKTCCHCKVSKTLDNFSVYKKAPDGLQHRCRDCKKIYAKEWYQKNSIKSRKSIKAWMAKQRLKIIDIVKEFLLNHPCIDCGEGDIRALDFDHKDPVLKSFNIGEAITGGKSIDTLLNEMSKCEIRCANCHRIKTYIQRGFTSRD